MPILFVGHGSPMNAIEDNVFRQNWQALGAEFGTTWPRPQLIVCISAHWQTPGWWLTGMAQPKTIHDFGGFPPVLFAQQYPAPGHPQAAKCLAQTLHQPDSGQPLQLDTHNWGLDHGAWGVLKPMFAAATTPVIQLSMALGRPAAEHFALGQQLKELRELGVLIVASGNLVHNLRELRMELADHQTYDWAQEFDQTVAEYIQSGHLTALQQSEKLPSYRKAHPSDDHFLPLLYAAGAAESTEPVRFFNSGFQAASISMRSVVWGWLSKK